MGNEFLLLLLLMWCCQCHSLRTNLNQNNLFKKIMINRGFTSLRENVAKFSVAPMLDYTYSHQRFLQRLISKRCTLYTEMVTANALVNTKDVNKELRANLQVEEPVVLQLGGADPLVMNRAAQIAYNFGYRDININVGCPSSRVSEAGCFGAALMLDPARVAELALSIQDVLHHPPTVKCRIGVNNDYDYERLQNFIEIIATKGNVNHFIVHARFAILNAKLSAEQNRKIPPLKYDVVYSLVKDFPNLRFTINGGLNSTKDCLDHLSKGVHGVMVGRAVVKNPFLWRNVDSLFYQEADPGKNHFICPFCCIWELFCYCALIFCCSSMRKSCNPMTASGLKPRLLY